MPNGGVPVQLHSFAGKRALETGGTKGIGSAVEVGYEDTATSRTLLRKHLGCGVHELCADLL